LATTRVATLGTHQVPTHTNARKHYHNQTAPRRTRFRYEANLGNGVDHIIISHIAIWSDDTHSPVSETKHSLINHFRQKLGLSGHTRWDLPQRRTHKSTPYVDSPAACRSEPAVHREGASGQRLDQTGSSGSPHSVRTSLSVSSSRRCWRRSWCRGRGRRTGVCARRA
jgi:hypothetical protein